MRFVHSFPVVPCDISSKTILFYLVLGAYLAADLQLLSLTLRLVEWTSRDHE